MNGRTWAALALIGAMIALAVIMAGNDPVLTGAEPITRAELMERYAEISPQDRTATPESVDVAADKACDLLQSGRTTDELIAAVTHSYGARSTQVVRLLVDYGCPRFAVSFK